MNIHTIVKEYQKNGYIPFPLSPHSKKPPKGSLLRTIENDSPFMENSNIGLFPGSPNGLLVVDADNEQSKQNLIYKLLCMGIFEKTTIVRTPRKGGLHFWLRCSNVPNGVKPLYNLSSQVGRVSLPQFCGHD